MILCLDCEHKEGMQVQVSGMHTNIHVYTHKHAHQHHSWYIPLSPPHLLSCIATHTTTHFSYSLSHSQSVFLFICHPSLALFNSAMFLSGFPLTYLKFPPGHKVLHSAEDFYRRSLGMGQPVTERKETNLGHKRKTLHIWACCKRSSGLFLTNCPEKKGQKKEKKRERQKSLRAQR